MINNDGFYLMYFIYLSDYLKEEVISLYSGWEAVIWRG